jgi:hypothetical protein|eukprot:COSAG01_NODE_613_length_14831_cov_8.108675_3_plen_95_part_00
MYAHHDPTTWGGDGTPPLAAAVRLTDCMECAGRGGTRERSHVANDPQPQPPFQCIPALPKQLIIHWVLSITPHVQALPAVLGYHKPSYTEHGRT